MPLIVFLTRTRPCIRWVAGGAAFARQAASFAADVLDAWATMTTADAGADTRPDAGTADIPSRGPTTFESVRPASSVLTPQGLAR